jgi:O-antigen ligase
MMLPIFYYAFFVRSKSWLHPYRGWFWVAGCIWAAMVMSFIANGPWFEARDLQYLGFAYLIRYFYWLLVFAVTAWLASDFHVQRRLSGILAVAVVVLACLRCFEGFVFGKVGAWSDTIFTTQNNYGILFSTFTPFLFPVFLGRGFLRKALFAIGLLVILYACAINGSRGSWICIALGLAVFCLLAFVSRPSASLRLILPVGFAALALVAILAGSTRVREAVLSRFSTFENLEGDKSYMFRQVMNQRSLKLFAGSPVFGTGPGGYREVYVPLEMPAVLARHNDADFTRKSAHNSYLHFLAESGAIGALPLVLLIGILAVRGCWAAACLNRHGEHWALGIYVSFIGMSVHFWAMAGLTTTSPWFIYGLLVATICLSSRLRKRKRASVARAPLVQRGLFFRARRPAVVGSPQPAILTTDH